MPEIFETVPTEAYLPQEREHALPAGTVRTWRWPARGDSRGTVLLVHGFRGDHHGLALIAQALRAQYDVVCPDLPGYGRSEPLVAGTHASGQYARIIAALAESAGPGPVFLVGHSYGSVIAARCVAEHLGRFAGLGLINPISEPALQSSQRLTALAASFYYRLCAALPRALGWPLVRSRAVTRISSEVMMKTRDPRLSQFINGQHDAYFGAFASLPVVLQSYEDSIRVTVADHAPEITTPALLIAAEQDDLGSPEAQRRLCGLFPAAARARLEMIPQAGHLLHYEAPVRCAGLLAEFFAECSREAAA